MHHYIFIECKYPREKDKYSVIKHVEQFVYRHLDEFGCLPRDDRLQKYIKREFGKEINGILTFMVQMTDEQAIKTAADRSEYKHPDSNKINKSEKRALRRVSKRKRSESDETVHKRLKDCRCPICLEDMDTKKNITMECNCVFHYSCIKKALSYKKVCPTCGTTVKI